MAAIAEERSKLTDRYQTTVPTGVRRALGLGKGDYITYRTDPSGRVYLEPASAGHNDPVLAAFLDHLKTDIATHPKRLVAFDGGLRDRLATLVDGVEVDLDETLSPDDE